MLCSGTYHIYDNIYVVILKLNKLMNTKNTIRTAHSVRIRTSGFVTALTALLLWAGGLTAHAQLTMTNGLVLWLQANRGVTTNASGQVTAWLDQSTSANNAAEPVGGTDSELPLLVPNDVNGNPAVRFDGVNNVLEILNSPSLQPQTGDWTVFFVAKRLTASQGDWPEVIGSRQWRTGLDTGWAVSFNSSGVLGSHLADGSTGHDLGVASSSAFSQTSFQMWQVEENRAGGATTFYLNGDSDVVRTPAMPTGGVAQADSVYIGREMDGANNRRANMDLAEVLVFNRVLAKSERESVSVYLSTKYGLGYVPNVLPTVSINTPTNGASFAIPASVPLSVTATDTDGYVKRVDFYANGSLFATASALPYSVPVSILSTGLVNLAAVATDNRKGATTSAPVAITITGSVPPVPLDVTNGLQLWLSADAGVTADSAGNVSVWADQSPNGNNALQDNSLAVPPTSFQPLLVTNAAGNTVVRFDGANSFMDIPNSDSLQPQNGDWTVLMAAQRGPNSMGDYPQIIGCRPWSAGVDDGWSVCFSGSGLIGSHFADGTTGHDVGAALSSSPLSLNTMQVWQVEENRTAGRTAFYLLGQTNRVLQTVMPKNAVSYAGDIYVGRDIEGGNGYRANMDLAEILVYNRTLTADERQQATTYLLNKYAVQQIFNQRNPPTVSLLSPTNGATYAAPATLNFSVSANDDGPVVSVSYYRGGFLLGTATNAPFALKTTLTSLGNSILTAVATDNLGLTSTSAPVSIALISPGIQLIGNVDYSDSFTTNAVRTDGLSNNNTNGAYNVENHSSNPAAVWTPTSGFTFNTPASSTDPAKVGAAMGNSGAATGLAQTGGGDSSFAYGLQTNYVVQVDAIMPSDRLDITTLPTAGGGIFAPNSLTVFLRRDSATSAPGIGLFNGTAETGVTNSNGAYVRTGVNDNNWHTFAVNFDQFNSQLKVYVDGVLLANVNPATFAGGIYQNFSNGAVGVGGSGGVFWLDNFKVGAPPQLIASVDYSDSFTINDIRWDGLYNDNSQGAYSVENSSTNPPATWLTNSAFGFNTPGSSTDPAVLGAAGGNGGAATGFAQCHNVSDFSMAYGLRSNYLVQVDAIFPSDRLDITSLPTAGGGILATQSLSIFFRRDSVAGAPNAAFPLTGLPGMGIFTSLRFEAFHETAVTDSAGNLIFTGVDDNDWHNVAVQFNQSSHKLAIYVDRILKTTIDLTTFAGGIYDNYSNGAVGFGGGQLASGGMIFLDNFAVGAPAATGPLGPLAIGLTGGQLRITWSGPATLQQAPSVRGPWTAVSDATSPYSTPATAQQQYYRLSQ